MVALEGKGPWRRSQKRLDRRWEEVAGAVGGGFCRLQMPLNLAVAVRETVAGRRLGALEGASIWSGCSVRIRLWPRLPRDCHRLLSIVPMSGASAERLASCCSSLDPASASYTGASALEGGGGYLPPSNVPAHRSIHSFPILPTVPSHFRQLFRPRARRGIHRNTFHATVPPLVRNSA